MLAIAASLKEGSNLKSVKIWGNPGISGGTSDSITCEAFSAFEPVLTTDFRSYMVEGQYFLAEK